MTPGIAPTPTVIESVAYIAYIRQYLTTVAAEGIAHARISSRLDYSNSLDLLPGIPKTQLHRLQLVQDSAATIISGVLKFDHITPTLISLHWLPVEQIHFKECFLVFKALCGLAPRYVSDQLSRKTKSHTPRSQSYMELCVRPN